MYLKLARVLCELVKCHGYDSNLIEDYSGRAMYGNQTVAVVVPSVHVVLEAVLSEPDAVLDDNGDPLFDAHSLKYDQFGKGWVIY